jgi:hypothetical protein
MYAPSSISRKTKTQPQNLHSGREFHHVALGRDGNRLTQLGSKFCKNKLKTTGYQKAETPACLLI